MSAKTKDAITSSLTGIAAYMFTDIIHEVIGHSGACLLQGHKITLLTSVYFRSTPPSVITDLGGPASNLLFALVLYAILVRRSSKSPHWRLFLFNAMSYNFFLFSGTILQSAFSKTGDWTYAMAALDSGVSGKLILVIVAIAAYYLSIRTVRAQTMTLAPHFPGVSIKGSIRYSYSAAAIAAFVGGLFFQAASLHTAIGGLSEMIASLPILFIATDSKSEVEIAGASPGWRFDVYVAVLLIVFCFTLGQGFAF